MKQMMKFLVLILIFKYVVNQEFPVWPYFAQFSKNWDIAYCKGTQQSPINLNVQKGDCDPKMTLNVVINKKIQNAQIIKDGCQLFTPGQVAHLYGNDNRGMLFSYDSKGFMFKCPSEHQIEGKQFDLEMQITFQIKSEFVDENYKEAVLSILFNQNDINPSKFFEQYDITQSTTTVNMPLLFEKITVPPAYYTYFGSQTLPPCKEDVNWYILNEIQGISKKDLEKFQKYYKKNLSFNFGYGNNRPIQLTNDRVVKRGGVKCKTDFVYFFSFIMLFVAVCFFFIRLV